MKADSNFVIALAIYLAIKGDASLLEKLEQEIALLWIGDGI